MKKKHSLVNTSASNIWKTQFEKCENLAMIYSQFTLYAVCTDRKLCPSVVRIPTLMEFKPESSLIKLNSLCLDNFCLATKIKSPLIAFLLGKKMFFKKTMRDVRTQIWKVFKTILWTN